MRALIIEDEPLAVDNLTFYLREYPIEIAGAAYRIRDAVKLIKKIKPDVIFLDINLSGENGFELLDRVDVDFKIIFVTAYDEYAIRAFEVNALDYILKPLKKERIAKAMERLLKGNCNDAPRQQYGIEDTIFLSTGLKACFLKLKDIHYIEADSCYSRVIVSENISKCSVQTLKKWSDILPVHEFVRIHRSYIVNVGHIARIEKRANGTYLVFLHHIDRPIEISRRCASDLRNKLSL
jgi:two-component system LytT family response regulator